MLATLRSIAKDAFAYCQEVTSFRIPDPEAWCRVSLVDGGPMGGSSNRNKYVEDNGEVTYIDDLPIIAPVTKEDGNCYNLWGQRVDEEGRY